MMPGKIEAIEKEIKKIEKQLLRLKKQEPDSDQDKKIQGATLALLSDVISDLRKEQEKLKAVRSKE